MPSISLLVPKPASLSVSKESGYRTMSVKPKQSSSTKSRRSRRSASPVSYAKKSEFTVSGTEASDLEIEASISRSYSCSQIISRYSSENVLLDECKIDSRDVLKRTSGPEADDIIMSAMTTSHNLIRELSAQESAVSQRGREVVQMIQSAKAMIDESVEQLIREIENMRLDIMDNLDHIEETLSDSVDMRLKLFNCLHGDLDKVAVSLANLRANKGLSADAKAVESKKSSKKIECLKTEMKTFAKIRESENSRLEPLYASLEDLERTVSKDTESFVNCSKSVESLKSWSLRMKKFPSFTPSPDTVLYELGILEIRSDEEAHRIEGMQKLRFSVARGFAPALFRICDSILCKEGIISDPDTAVKLLTAAAEGGVLEAEERLGMLLLSGECSGSPASAEKWLLRAAERGSVVSMRHLGDLYRSGVYTDSSSKKDLNHDAFVWFAEAARRGDVYSMEALGNIYLKGNSAVKKDEELGVKWLQFASERGSMSALVQLGLCYHQGTGVPRSASKARGLWKKGALQGSAECCEMLEKWARSRGGRLNSTMK